MQSQTISLERKPISSSSTTPRTCRSAGKWEYKCIFCWKTFESGRALGGHQNAHRFEPRYSKRTHHLRLPKQQENYYYYDHHSLLIPSSPKNLMKSPSPQPLSSLPDWYNHHGQIILIPLLQRQFPQDMESGVTSTAAASSSSRIESDLIIRPSVAAKGAKDGATEVLDLELRL